MWGGGGGGNPCPLPHTSPGSRANWGQVHPLQAFIGAGGVLHVYFGFTPPTPLTPRKRELRRGEGQVIFVPPI
jgi:hypothetical protein